MAIAATAIRTAIAEALEGAIGGRRKMSAAVFLRGVFDGQPLTTKQAIAMQTTGARHRCDVLLGSVRDNQATSVSAIGIRRIANIDIRIPIITHVASVAQPDARASVLESIDSDLEDAVEALCTPGNLTATAGSVATKIVSGMMLGPLGSDTPALRIVREDWNAQLIESEITGLVVVTITSNT